MSTCTNCGNKQAMLDSERCSYCEIIRLEQQLSAANERVKELERQLGNAHGQISILCEHNDNYKHQLTTISDKVRQETAEHYEKRINLLREALESISQYWNGGQESSVDACEHDQCIADEALREDNFIIRTSKIPGRGK